MSRPRAVRPGVERARLDDLAQVRVLAHPLRLRVLQSLAERPATAKQVAELLGEPPTRLYHHVHVLERAGLIRLREVRPNRGTTERYYEAVARKFEFGRHVLERTPRTSGPRAAASRSATPAAPAGDDVRARQRDARAIAGVVRAATSVMNLGLGDLRALKRHSVRIEPGIEPFVARTLVAGSRAQIRALRTDLMRLLERHARRESAASTTEERYTLTLAFVPESRPRRRGRR